MIINMTGAYQPPTNYISSNGYTYTTGSTKYSKSEPITVSTSFKPKMVYGWAQFASGTRRAVCGGEGDSGYQAASDGTYNNKAFTFGSNYVTFIPNGTAGTCYYYIAGTY